MWAPNCMFCWLITLWIKTYIASYISFHELSLSPSVSRLFKFQFTIEHNNVSSVTRRNERMKSEKKSQPALAWVVESFELLIFPSRIVSLSVDWCSHQQLHSISSETLTKNGKKVIHSLLLSVWTESRIRLHGAIMTTSLFDFMVKFVRINNKNDDGWWWYQEEDYVYRQQCLMSLLFLLFQWK